MSLKILHFLLSPRYFSGKYRALDNDHDESFHHANSAMEKTYQSKCISPMMAGCCWEATRDSPGLVYKWSLKRQHN